MDKNDKTINESWMDGNSVLAAGAWAGAIGTAGALITGAVCPRGIIARPILLGVGFVKRMKLHPEHKKLQKVKP